MSVNSSGRKKASQYTIRSVPDRVDRALRLRARTSRKSLNQVALEALAAGAGESLRPKRDFSQVIGSMSDNDAREVEAEIKVQRKVDKALWK